MRLVDFPSSTLERIRGMTELRDCAHELINYQLSIASGVFISIGFTVCPEVVVLSFFKPKPDWILEEESNFGKGTLLLLLPVK